ncbi:MAG: peptidylprolyl isomerase [Melioribacteraceae bacterium]|jgi:peptidyl-prolyl cis-trans isomerase SurA|nr:peptidylprolyl isomerase [Melioribacteraceae bacterium]
MKKYILVIFLLSINLFAQQVLDRIVAVVDNEVILKTELDFRVNYVAAQKNLNPSDPLVVEQVLNEMIEEKFMYAQAELDSVTVKDEQVNQQLEYQINYFVQQYGSRERLEQVYGMPVEKLKRSLYDDTKKNLMVQVLQQKRFGQVEASRKEVEDFYDTFKDSLGIVPDKYHISHIFQNPKTGDRVKTKAREFAQFLLDSLKKGADFDELAKKYSDDPGSASQGGDLGFVKRGVFYPEFEAAAFALMPNQMSTVIESPVGFHIIQLLERRGDAIRARHILTKVKADDQADLAAIEFLSDIRDSILKNVNTFEYFARKYSDDKESAKFGGNFGIFETSQLEKSLLDVIYKLKDGEISFPKRLEIDRGAYGYHIVKLVKRIPQHKANLEMDYDEIKKLAEFQKKQKMYDKLIDDIRSKIYYEIRL